LKKEKEWLNVNQNEIIEETKKIDFSNLFSKNLLRM
jgi:hypothetical protein